ncbi:MAG TPA: prepilin-type N-terminal cleavage/methylation domain-containing protein [Verrucomicrobiae bacterium]|nr:prepilin-type N-terminal cleavage/methylation domain-containing protein [Verrucomicrobiae bacterium]
MFSQNIKIPPKDRRCDQAFTLIEVMVALVIIGIMFTAIYKGIIQSFAVTKSTQESLRATQILQDKTETIHLYTWNQINTAGFVSTTFTNWFDPAGGTNQGTMFTGALSITNAPLADNPSYKDQLKLVTVTVSWTSGTRTCQQQMTTLISHYGLQNYIYN